MTAAKKPDPRLVPLSQEATPALAGAFQTYVKVLVPNSVLVMQRKPKRRTIHVAEKHLANSGWSVGKHAR